MFKTIAFQFQTSLDAPRCTNPLHSDLQILKVPNLGRQRFEVVIPKEERPEQDMRIFFLSNYYNQIIFIDTLK